MKRALMALLAAFTVTAMDIKAIYHPEGELRPMDKFALEDLSEHLEKSLGHKVPLAVEPATVQKDAIYFGHTKFAAANKIDFSSFKQEEWLVKETNGTVILGGNSIHGNLYAVYEFLERFADIDWFDEHTTYIPSLKEIKIPANTELRGAPSVRYRGIYTYKTYDDHVNIFKVRNRENIFWEKPKNRIFEIGFRPVLGRPRPLNTFNFYVQDWPKEGFEQFYSQDKKGKRLRPKDEYGPGQICFSNKDCQDKFANQMIEYIKKDREEFPDEYPLLYNLSANDCIDTCYCENCQALADKYGAQSGAMMEFVNAVAQKVEKAFPDITIQTSAYLLFEKAPTGIGVNRNVAVRNSLYPAGMGMDTMRSINDPTNEKPKNELLKWVDLGRIQIWNYWVCYGETTHSNACIVNIDSIHDNIRTYHSLGADYIFSECEYPDTTTFHPLRVWFGYRILNDVNADKDALLQRFFTKYYGPAAPYMFEYYDYLRKRQPEAKRLESRSVLNKKYIDQAFFVHCLPLLEKARAAVNDDPLRTTHVRNELVPLEIAALICTPEKDPAIPSKDVLLEHLRDNWTNLHDFYYGKKASKSAITDFIAAREAPKSGAKYPVPPETEGKTVYEVAYDGFNKLSEMSKFGLRLVDDADSPTGKAMRIGKEARDAEEFHKDQLTSGFQDRSIMKGFHSYEFKRESLPQDEKYHFVNVGTVELHVASLFWMHRTWFIQQDFSRFFRRGENNKYDVWVSVKFTGPAYVKGSTKENAISIDRFILAQ